MATVTLRPQDFQSLEGRAPPCTCKNPTMMASPNFQVSLHAEPMMGGQQPVSYGGPQDAQGIGMPSGGKLPVSLRCDSSYIKTFPGMVKVAEIINNIVGMICIMISKCSWCSNSNWYNFVGSTGLTVTGLLLLFYLLHIVEKLKFVPWLAIELLYCATWTLFYMIAALVVAVKGGRDDAWAAAGFFGFVGALLYATDCYTKYKSWRDGIPAQGEKPLTPNYAAY